MLISRPRRRQARRDNAQHNKTTTNNRLRRLTKRSLREIDRQSDQSAFDRWLASIKKSKHSLQEDLPSSQLMPKMAQVRQDIQQLFVVLDTCSVVTYRTQLIDLVIRLKRIYPKQSSPIKIIISLIVLEELDKCNRRSKPSKPSSTNKPPEANTTVKQEAEGTASGSEKVVVDSNLHDVLQAMKANEPPRSFMRFIEEEMRAGEVLISELDPYKRASLGERGQSLEILNHDDRILECCLRSQEFIRSIAHHPATKVILVTEDNLFKSKATTFEIASYRWAEFEAKFKNFGLKNYTSTPQIPPPPTSTKVATTAAAASYVLPHIASGNLAPDLAELPQIAAQAVVGEPVRKMKKGAKRPPTRLEATDDSVIIVSELIKID